MKKEENLHVVSEEPGIICDNPGCDYTDPTANGEDLSPYLNKPCPKCGENLLTEEDLNSYLEMKAMIEFINNLSPEQLKEFNDSIPEELKAQTIIRHPELKTEDLENPVTISFTVKAHKGIQISDVKVEKSE